MLLVHSKLNVEPFPKSSSHVQICYLIRMSGNLIVHDFSNSLPEHAAQRYERKIIEYFDGVDPYSIPWTTVPSPLPKNVTRNAIEGYFLRGTSEYTSEMFEAYKGLDSYKYYEAGFVQSIRSYEFERSIAVVAVVRHSQRMNEPPLNCWVADFDEPLY